MKYTITFSKKQLLNIVTALNNDIECLDVFECDESYDKEAKRLSKIIKKIDKALSDRC